MHCITVCSNAYQDAFLDYIDLKRFLKIAGIPQSTSGFTMRPSAAIYAERNKGSLARHNVGLQDLPPTNDASIVVSCLQEVNLIALHQVDDAVFLCEAA